MTIRNVDNTPLLKESYQSENNDNSISQTQTPLLNTSTNNAEKAVAPASTEITQQSLPAKKILNHIIDSSASTLKLSKSNNRKTLSEQRFQTTKNSLQRGIVKIDKAMGQFRNNADAQLKNIADTAGKLSNNLSDFTRQLSDNNNISTIKSLEKLPELSQEFVKLHELIKTTDQELHTNTGDHLFNIEIQLRVMDASVKKLASAVEKYANGDLFAVKSAITTFQQGRNSGKVAAQESKNYTDHVTQLFAPIKAQTAAIDSLLKSNNSSINSELAEKLATFNPLTTAQELADIAYRFSYQIDYSTPFVKAYFSGLQHLWQSVYLPDFNPNGKSIPTNSLVENTADLRAKIAAAQAGDNKAATELQSRYGYSVETAPKPGRMWLASNFVAGDLENNRVTADNFPGSKLQTGNAEPPDPAQLLFGESSKGVELKDANGQSVTVKTIDEYRAVIAAKREKLSLPIQNGDPIGVQVTFEGGGGFGKRHAPALAEMYNIGIVPASVTGVSAGAITAGLIAAGLSPAQADTVSKDPAIDKFFDTQLTGPGLLKGREFYRYMDEKLREITGIKDRPVTFADLKIPLQIVATKFADSEAANDMTRVEERVFLFSKETTPDTPVAMAMTASAAVPGSFDPVEFVDVSTGRTIRLVDGGMVNNLPIGYQRNDLPEIAIQLQEPNKNNPNAADNQAKPKPLPKGNLISNTPFGNGQLGIKVYTDSAEEARNFQARTNPPPGVFVLNLPVWNLKNFRSQDSVIDYQYDQRIDPDLDKQTTEITDNFLRDIFVKLSDHNASGTNLKRLPQDLSFTRTIKIDDTNWMVSYSGAGDEVVLTSENGKKHKINLGQTEIENWVADNASFGDLEFRLRDLIIDHQQYLHKLFLG